MSVAISAGLEFGSTEDFLGSMPLGTKDSDTKRILLLLVGLCGFKIDSYRPAKARGCASHENTN